MEFAELVLERLDALGENINSFEAKQGWKQGYLRAFVRNDGKRSNPNIDKAQDICDALGIEFYIGPPRSNPAPVAVVQDQVFDTVPRYDVQSAAGNGVINLDGKPTDYLAFSKVWLGQNGINAGSCALINVKGDSMEPSIYDGDLVMLDRRKTAVRSGRIYVFRDGDEGLRLKRLDVIPDTAITLRSDNLKYPPEPRIGDAMNDITQNIIGEVVWSGHKWV